MTNTKEHINVVNRERAVEFFYKIDLLNSADTNFLKDVSAWPKSYSYARNIVEYYFKNSDGVDRLITENLIDWKLSRLPFIDRAILRVGFSELILGLTPKGVVLNEAVRLANEYSGVESPNFINGVLAKFASSLNLK